MGEFQRNPSKVWWANMELNTSTADDQHLADWRHNRTANSASPGSQDSGFSDTETSPHHAAIPPPASTSKDSSGTSPQSGNSRTTETSTTTTNSSSTTTNSSSTTTQEENRLTHVTCQVVGGYVKKRNSVTASSTNLSTNIKEKCTPQKENSIGDLLDVRYQQLQGAHQSLTPNVGCYGANTPVRRPREDGSKVSSEPATSYNGRFTKRHQQQKVNRNLFQAGNNTHHQYSKDSLKDDPYHVTLLPPLAAVNINTPVTYNTVENIQDDDQTPVASFTLCQNVTDGKHLTDRSNNSDNITCEEDESSTGEIPSAVQSLPTVPTSPPVIVGIVNSTVPPATAIRKCSLEVDGDVDGDYVSDGSEDSELEELFTSEGLESPRHTSTPKASLGGGLVMGMGSNRAARRKVLGEEPMDRVRQMQARNLQGMYTREYERVPPVQFNIEDYNAEPCVQAWYSNIRNVYDTECMTTLQCKSIAGDLAEKVTKLAASVTQVIRNFLRDSMIVRRELQIYKNTSSTLSPNDVTQLTSLINTYLSRHTLPTTPTGLTNPVASLLSLTTPSTTPSILGQLETRILLLQRHLVSAAIDNYIDCGLRNPRSELEVRAYVTGLTSLCLRDSAGCQIDSDLGSVFVTAGAVEALTALCDRCEGSSVRAGIWRALATVCTGGGAIERFVSAGGVDVLVDIVTDDALPEPERVEAVALLAQITAPWIEDNHTALHTLQSHTKQLVKHLTRYSAQTRCVQNLLLCAAALANLSTMYTTAHKHFLYHETVRILLESVRKHTRNNTAIQSIQIKLNKDDKNILKSSNGKDVTDGLDPSNNTAAMGTLNSDKYAKETSSSDDYSKETSVNRSNNDLVSLSNLIDPGSQVSVYLLEQLATLIANLSGSKDALAQLIRDNVPAALVCFLQTRETDGGDVVRRVQQKAIIALSRLCGDVTAARQVVGTGGVERLVSLCRERTQRHDSDVVLVAALATLRKISETCGESVMNTQDSQELVEPRLLDSFLAYSAQNESLV